MTEELAVSTKDHPGDYDALETAKPDEPIFVVQGGDPLGPSTVQFWADGARSSARSIMYGEHAGFEPTGERDEYEPTEADKRDAEKLLKKATSAEQVSWAMRAYQRNEIEPTGGRATYNDTPPIDLTAEALDRETTRKALIVMTGQLHNSLAVAEGVREALVKLGLHSDVAAEINKAVESLRLASVAIEPRRGSERS